MNSLILIIGLLFAFQSLADTGNSRGLASEDMVKKAMENPRRYRFDDGGNIDFGNGFFKRRFNFAGQPQVCHENNIIYGGHGKKCMVKIAKQECKQYQSFTLMTEMVGEKQICNSYGSREAIESSEIESFRCDRPSVIKFNRGPKVKVKIYESSKMNGKGNGGFVGYTYLTIPACNF